MSVSQDVLSVSQDLCVFSISPDVIVVSVRNCVSCESARNNELLPFSIMLWLSLRLDEAVTLCRDLLTSRNCVDIWLMISDLYASMKDTDSVKQVCHL